MAIQKMKGWEITDHQVAEEDAGDRLEAAFRAAAKRAGYSKPDEGTNARWLGKGVASVVAPDFILNVYAKLGEVWVVLRQGDEAAAERFVSYIDEALAA